MVRVACGAALVLEAAQLPLYAVAFGLPVLAMLAVRALLTVVLVVFTVRGAPVARVVLGAVRLMAGLVGVIMATIVDGSTALAVALGVLCALDAVVGFALITAKQRRVDLL